MPVWEALAVLVALRTWRSSSHSNALFSVRSDSRTALHAMAKMASSRSGISLLLREIALDEAELHTQITCLTHIPGHSNTWADALSRLEAPEPLSVPEPLLALPRVSVAWRDRSFYPTLWKP